MIKAALTAGLLLAAAPAVADPVPAWTHQLPTSICFPTYPSNACLTTPALDLRRARYYRVSLQAMNFAPGVVPAASKIRLRDANNIAAGCFGQACTVITVPFSAPAQGSCCMGTYTSEIVPIPASQRRASVALRIEIIGGYYNSAGSGMPPVIQFYTD